jgi:hypothetical protein
MARCSTAAFPKLFMFREVAMQVSLVTISCPPQELFLTSLFTLFTTGYKRHAEEGQKGFLMGNFDWLAVTCL